MLGQSLAAAAAGSVAENLGVEPAMMLPLCAGLVAVLAGLVNWLLTPSTAR
jgi:hypothetical protein